MGPRQTVSRPRSDAASDQGLHCLQFKCRCRSRKCAKWMGYFCCGMALTCSTGYGIANDGSFCLDSETGRVRSVSPGGYQRQNETESRFHGNNLFQHRLRFY